MNRKQLIILLAALIILGGAGLVLRNRNEESWSSAGTKLGQKVLPNFQVNDVAALHIKANNEVNIVRKDDHWLVRERGDYPANFTQIRDLLLKMDDLKIAQSEPIGPSQLGRMQLAAPSSGPDSATLLEFKDSQGKVLQSLLVGKKHVRKEEQPSPMSFGGGGFPDGRYVMLPGDPHDVLTVSDALNTVDAKPDGWLDKSFFKVEKVKSISLESTNAANSWSLTRATESSPWVLSGAKPGEVLDTNKVSSLSSTLSYPTFVDVPADQSPAKTGLDKPLVVTLTTFDDFAYVLKIGKKTANNNYNMTVAVSADLQTQRTPGKDEKPDDKKKLDKEFQDKLKPLQDKLDQEKALSKTTYLVNTWLIDPLIRPRGDLMVGKKDDKKEASASPAGAPDDAGTLFPPSDSDSK